MNENKDKAQNLMFSRIVSNDYFFLMNEIL